MPRQTVVAEFEWAAWLAAVLLALSIVLGGGGSPAPLLEVALQCCATLAAAAWLFANRDGLGRVPARAWWLAGLIALLPALQLIPLPPALWQGLPGRADQRAALDLVAAGDSWRALTLSPPRTVASLLAALAAGLSLVMAASLGERGRIDVGAARQRGNHAGRKFGGGHAGSWVRCGVDADVVNARCHLVKLRPASSPSTPMGVSSWR